MQTLEEFERLLLEAAEQACVRSVVQYEGDVGWRVDFDEATSFDIEYDASTGRMLLAASLGEVADAGRLRAYELLLMYNGLRWETGIARMALDGEDGQIVMLLETAARSDATGGLADTLSNTAAAQRAWREILDGIATQEETTAQPQAADTDAALRVHP